MTKYYLMAINKGCHFAMYNFGTYHHFITKNYDLMKKYYLMAEQNGNKFAMGNLCHYYQSVHKENKESNKSQLICNIFKMFI